MTTKNQKCRKCGENLKLHLLFEHTGLKIYATECLNCGEYIEPLQSNGKSWRKTEQLTM